MDIQNGVQIGWNKDWNSVKLSPEEKRELESGTYRLVRNTDLNHLIRRGNTMRLLAKEEHQQTVLPDRTRSQACTVPVGHFVPSARPCPPNNDLDCAHPALPETLAEDPFSVLQPPEPIDCHQASPEFVPQDFQYAFDPISKPDNRPVSQGDDPKWPLWVHARRNEEGHVISAKNSLMTSDDSLETAADKTETGKCREQWAAPPGLKTRSSWNLEDNLAKSSEAEQDTSSQQLNQNGRYTPTFFTQPQENGEPWIKEETKKQKTGSAPAMTEFFNLHEFFVQAKASIKAAARHKLQYADCRMREEPHEIGITNTLVCLQDSEWKYLPLWAGGYDDGSGGVFSDQIPAADLGFSTPGPEVHTGITPANSIRTPSEFSMVDSDCGVDTINTANTSMVNKRSFTDAFHRKRVYAADSMGSTSSDEFDIVTTESDSEEEKARRQTEAQEQVEAAEEEAVREAQRIRKGTAIVVDENYADLFNDDEGNETDRAEGGDFMMNESDEDDDTVMV